MLLPNIDPDHIMMYIKHSQLSVINWGREEPAYTVKHFCVNWFFQEITNKWGSYVIHDSHCRKSIVVKNFAHIKLKSAF